jgi:hypothetical protein
VASEHPLVIAVDDMHWIDAPSRQALLFAVRRLERDAVVMLCGERVAEGDGTDPQGWTEVSLRGLDRRAVRELASRVAEVEIEIEIGELTADRLLRATAGNPLAIIEVARLGPNALRDLADESFAVPIPRLIDQMIRARISGLPDVTSTALLVVALNRSGRVDEIHAALERIERQPSDLDPALDDGLLCRRDGQLAFEHPLVRAVVVSIGTEARRRLVNEALAAVASIHDAAWYRAEAVLGTDGKVADLLWGSRSALAFGGAAAATGAMVKAARVTPTGATRAERLVGAAIALYSVGRHDEAEALLAEGSLDYVTASLQPRAAIAKGMIETARGSTQESVARMVRGSGLAAAGYQLVTVRR